MDHVDIPIVRTKYRRKPQKPLVFFFLWDGWLRISHLPFEKGGKKFVLSRGNVQHGWLISSYRDLYSSTRDSSFSLSFYFPENKCLGKTYCSFTWALQQEDFAGCCEFSSLSSQLFNYGFSLSPPRFLNVFLDKKKNLRVFIEIKEGQSASTSKRCARGKKTRPVTNS